MEKLINIALVIVAVPLIVAFFALIVVMTAFTLIWIVVAWAFGAKVNIKIGGEVRGYVRWFTFYPN